jgi:hypothetical protein
MIRTLLTTTAIAALLGTAVIAQDTTPANTMEAPANTMEAPADTTAPDNAMDAPANDMEAPANDIEAPGNEVETPAAPPPATTTPAPAGDAVGTEVTRESFDLSQGYVVTDGDNLVTRLLGSPVYSSGADDAEEFGNINDLVFDENGNLIAAVIGVGGFLGIGEKQVAVDFGELEWTVAADNTERWVLATTREALETAPEFVWEEEEVNPAADPAMAPADPAMAPAAPAAPVN